MKHKRFSDEQVIGVLKEHEAGAKVDETAGGTRSAARPSTPGGRVRRNGSERCEAAARARGGERQAEADRRGPGAGHVGDEGTARKTLVSPWPGDEPWAS